MRFTIRTLPAAALCALLLTTALTACERSRPAAGAEGSALLRVGSTVVTVDDFLDAVRMRGGPGTVPDAATGDFERYREVLVRGLTVEALLVEEARLRGLHVDDAEVDDRLSAARERFPDDFDAFVKTRFGGLERYRALLARQALTEACERVIRKELARDSMPRPEDVEAYFEAHKDSFAVPERAKVVQLAAPGEEQADELRKRFLQGEPIDTLAVEARRMGGEGGVMGWFERDTMPPWFEQAVWTRKGGRVSKVFEAEGLFRIVQVTDLQPATEADLEQVRERIERRLQLERIDERFGLWVDARLGELRLHTDRALLASITCCRGGMPYIRPEDS